MPVCACLSEFFPAICNFYVFGFMPPLWQNEIYTASQKTGLLLHFQITQITDCCSYLKMYRGPVLLRRSVYVYIM